MLLREAVSARVQAPSVEIEGQLRPPRDKIVPRKFGPVAKYLWRGRKPAAAIAAIAKCDIRTGKRILAGEADIPVELLLAACLEMLKPIEQETACPSTSATRRATRSPD